ncbi:MAG: carboxypeptidase-like regulatory domain-containing protein [Gemmatimonadales bacterium]
MRQLLPGLIAAAVIAGQADGQTIVTGVVLIDGSRKPIPGAVAVVEGQKGEAVTDETGRFVLGTKDGTRILLVRMIGYQPSRIRLQVPKGDTVRTEVLLVPRAVQQLDSIVAEGEVQKPRGVGIDGFEERRRLGFGKFIAPEYLRRMEHRRVSDVLREIPGMKLVVFVPDPSRPWDWQLRAISTRSGANDCYMTVLVDTSPIYRAKMSGVPPDFRREFTEVSYFEAIEVYRGPSEVPHELGGPAEVCGLLQLWTRRPGE